MVHLLIFIIALFRCKQTWSVKKDYIRRIFVMFVEFVYVFFFLQSTCYTSIIGFTKFFLKNSGTDISMI